jgi:hypothetical protein
MSRAVVGQCNVGRLGSFCPTDFAQRDQDMKKPARGGLDGGGGRLLCLDQVPVLDALVRHESLPGVVDHARRVVQAVAHSLLSR